MAVMTLAAHLAAGLNLFALSPLLPLAIEDYGISHWKAGLLVSLPMLVGAAIGIPGGMLIARVGVKRAYMWAWVAMALLALAPVVPNFYVLLILRLAYGVGLALMVVATGPLVMQWFRPKEMLVINSLNTAILSLGVAASVAGAVPLAGLLGWKMTLTVFSAVGIFGALLWPAAPRDRDTGEERRPGISVREVITVLRGRAVALLVAADMGIFIQYTALTTWLPSFYEEARGISLQEAGFITSILPFVGIFAVLSGGAVPFLFETFRSKLAVFGRPGNLLFSYRGILVFSGILAILGGLGAFLFDWSQAGHLCFRGGVGRRLLVLCASTADHSHAAGGSDAGARCSGVGVLHDLLGSGDVHFPHSCGLVVRLPGFLLSGLHHLRRGQLVSPDMRAVPAA